MRHFNFNLTLNYDVKKLAPIAVVKDSMFLREFLQQHISKQILNDLWVLAVAADLVLNKIVVAKVVGECDQLPT